MQLGRREPGAKSARFAIIAGLAVTHAAVGKYLKVLCVSVPNNRSLDVIVRDQHRLWRVLGGQQQPGKTCDEQKKESHKQQFTSSLNSPMAFEMNGVAIKKAGDLPPACWLNVEVTE